jgi:hypothetical protein
MSSCEYQIFLFCLKLERLFTIKEYTFFTLISLTIMEFSPNQTKSRSALRKSEPRQTMIAQQESSIQAWTKINF